MAISCPAGATAAHAAAVPRYSPHPGDVRVLRVSMKGTVDLDLRRFAAAMGTHPTALGEAKSLAQAFELSGELHTRVLGRRGGSWRVVARLQKVSFVVAGEPAAATPPLEQPFVLTLSPRGAVEKVEFARGLPRDAERTLRGLVEALQVVLGPNPQANGWTAEEPTAEGPKTVAYQVTGTDPARGVVSLSRKVLSAKSTLSGPGSAATFTPTRTEIVRSEGSVEWSTSGKGLVSLHVDDAENGYMGDDRVLSGRSTLTAEVVDTGIAELPGTEDEAGRALSDSAAAGTRFYDVPPEFERLLAGLDARSMVAKFTAEVHTHQANSVPLLKYYVRKHPQDVRVIAEAMDALGGTERDATAIGFAWAAIAAAGHTQAQAVLAEALAGETFRNPHTRARALGALLSLERPERFLLPIVWDTRESLPTEGPNANYLRSFVTNLYGALGAVEHGVPENTLEVVRTLSSRLRSTRDPIERHFMLVALSNTGDLDRTLPLVEPYFASEDERLRDAAFEIFRKAEGERAFEAFARRYAAETSPAVRRAASEVAVAMPDTAARSAWAASESARETDTTLLDRQVRILGDTLRTRPENGGALRRLLHTVDDRPVRKTIYRYVGPVAAEGTR